MLTDICTHTYKINLSMSNYKTKYVVLLTGIWLFWFISVCTGGRNDLSLLEMSWARSTDSRYMFELACIRNQHVLSCLLPFCHLHCRVARPSVLWLSCHWLCSLQSVRLSS